MESIIYSPAEEHFVHGQERLLEHRGVGLAARVRKAPVDLSGHLAARSHPPPIQSRVTSRLVHTP
jgi:hypothetical protein